MSNNCSRRQMSAEAETSSSDLSLNTPEASRIRYLLCTTPGLEEVAVQWLRRRLPDTAISITSVPREHDAYRGGGDAAVGRVLVTVPHAHDTPELRAFLRGDAPSPTAAAAAATTAATGVVAAVPTCIALAMALLTIDDGGSGAVGLAKESLPALAAAVARAPFWPQALSLLSRHLEDQSAPEAAARVAAAAEAAAAVDPKSLVHNACPRCGGSGSGGTRSSSSAANAAASVDGSAGQPLAFRASCARSGRHAWNSIEGAAAIGAAVGCARGWRASMKGYDAEVMALVLGQSLTCGIVLRNARRNCYHKVPAEPRSYLTQATRMAMLRPTTAHLLIHLARVDGAATAHTGSGGDGGAGGGDAVTILDPMGGVGTIAIEAATVLHGARCISSDIDSDACAAARGNATRAAELRLLVGTVEVHQWDVTALSELPACSVDAVISDMPFGRAYGCADTVRSLAPRALVEAHRVLRSGGRAVLLSSHGAALLAAANLAGAGDRGDGGGGGAGGQAVEEEGQAPQEPQPLWQRLEAQRWRCDSDLPVVIGGVIASVLVLTKL